MAENGSFLLLHSTLKNSCEFFLDLAADRLEVNKTRLGFLEYWEALNKKLEKKGKKDLVTQKRAMGRLNKARNSLKHHGIAPRKADIETYRVNVTNFLEENITTIFGIEFRQISLINLIKNKKAKKALKLAEKHLEQKRYQEALGKVVEGYFTLIGDYEKTIDKQSYLRKHSFLFEGSRISFSSGGYENEVDDLASNVESFADEVTNSLLTIEEALRVTSLGLDYRKYLKFCSLIPMARKINIKAGSWFGRTKHLFLSEKEVNFCISFVLETALKIQDFTN